MKKLLTQLTLGFALISLITVALIAIFANVLVRGRFNNYVEGQQEEYAYSIADGLSLQYDAETDEWNVDYIHGMGMYALNDSYIIKVYNKNGGIVWDAENHDMTSCHHVMMNILEELLQLREETPEAFTTVEYSIIQNGEQIGNAEITYYSAGDLGENAAQFLSSLNFILVIVGLFSLIAAVLFGFFFAGKISKPITQLANVTEDIAGGNYATRCDTTVSTEEIQTLTQSVNHMAEKIEKQEALRRRLTSDVAHELRTPLANVSSYLEAMSEGIWEPTPERLMSCYEEIGRLTSIVSELEKIRQIENENLSLERTEFDFKTLVDNTASLFEREMSAKKLSCAIQNRLMMIIADEKKLRQLLMNLLSNAVKYSHEGGNIEIGWEERETEWMFFVRDDGIGFPQEEAKNIFERFYRTDISRTRGTGGVGIGLTIVKAIAEAHGGSVTAESELGKGSVFTVTIPKTNGLEEIQ